MVYAPQYGTPSSAPTGTICRRVLIPDDATFLLAVNDVLSRLGFADAWESGGDGHLSPDETAALMAEMVYEFLTEECVNDSLPVGTIIMFGGQEAPEGWLLCNGAFFEPAQHQALFDVIGFTYGSAETFSLFKLPDFRGRSPMGAGAGPNLTSRAVGDRVGSETAELLEIHLPAHAHSIPAHTHAVPPHSHNIRGNSSGTSGGFATRFLRSNNTAAADLSTDNSPEFSTGSAGGGFSGSVGSDNRHENVHPVLVVQHIIKAV